MKLLLDFLPVLIFFGVYKFSGDIILATAVLIPATALQVLWGWLKHRRLERMQLVTLGLVVLLGGATVAFNDDTFIKWKPTIVNWLFALVFLGSEWIGGKNIIQRMMESNLSLPGHVWRNLNFGWVAFFVISGAVNLFVAYQFSQETWVNFKLFGILGMTLAFIVIQGLFLSRYLKAADTEKDDAGESGDNHSPRTRLSSVDS